MDNDLASTQTLVGLSHGSHLVDHASKGA